MAAYRFITFLLCLTTSVWGQSPPTITNISQNQIRDIGGQVDLNCSVHNKQDYPTLWVKYDPNLLTETFPLSVNDLLIIRVPRFSLRYNDAKAIYTLSIKDIKESDAGIYQCQILRLNASKVSAEVELKVRKSPITDKKSSESLPSDEKNNFV